MDIHMPQLDGLAAARRMRELEAGTAHTPIIALTANAMSEDRAAYLDAGMDDHVAKPIETRVLVRAIERAIARQETATPA
jgi:CheY-like chemotaxis protein